MSRVTTTALPQPSAIHATLPGADFWDAYAAPDPTPAASALQAWLDLVAQTPRWAQRLMALRNRLVRLVGLKDLGQLDDGLPAAGPARAQAARYRVGDRVGIFTIRHLDAREVVMGQDDKHLDVQVSLCKREQDGRPVVVLGSVVHVHNMLGHAYMAVIKPFHRRIVRALLARLPRTATDHGTR